MRSGRSILSYSGRSGAPPHSVCSGRSPCCPHSGPRSLFPQHCRSSLEATRNTRAVQMLCNAAGLQEHPYCSLLTYACIGTVHSAVGVRLVAWGAPVALGARGVVHAVLAHSSARPAAGLKHSLVEVTALGVVVALAT